MPSTNKIKRQTLKDTRNIEGEKDRAKDWVKKQTQNSNINMKKNIKLKKKYFFLTLLTIGTDLKMYEKPPQK